MKKDPHSISFIYITLWILHGLTTPGFSQVRDKIIGDWHYLKTTSKSGQRINASPNFKRIEFKGKNWARVYFFDNEARSIQYTLWGDSIKPHFTNSALDPHFLITDLTFDQLVLKNEFGSHWFSRIIKIVETENEIKLITKRDTIRKLKHTFHPAFINKNLADYFLAHLKKIKTEQWSIVEIQGTVKKKGVIDNVTSKSDSTLFPIKLILDSLLRNTNGLWRPAKIGSKFMDVNVKFSIPIFSESEINSEERMSDWVSKKWLQGKSFQENHLDNEAINSFTESELAFDFLSQCSFYSRTKISISTYESFLNSMCNKGVILLNLGRKQEGCLTLKKVGGQSLQAVSLFERFCE